MTKCNCSWILPHSSHLVNLFIKSASMRLHAVSQLVLCPFYTRCQNFLTYSLLHKLFITPIAIEVHAKVGPEVYPISTSSVKNIVRRIISIISGNLNSRTIANGLDFLKLWNSFKSWHTTGVNKIEKFGTNFSSFPIVNWYFTK